MLDLCSARRTFDASMAVKGQSGEEHARTQLLRDDLFARERKTGAACKGVAKQRRASKSEAPPVVGDSTSDSRGRLCGHVTRTRTYFVDNRGQIYLLAAPAGRCSSGSRRYLPTRNVPARSG